MLKYVYSKDKDNTNKMHNDEPSEQKNSKLITFTILLGNL